MHNPRSIPKNKDQCTHQERQLSNNTNPLDEISDEAGHNPKVGGDLHIEWEVDGSGVLFVQRSDDGLYHRYRVK